MDRKFVVPVPKEKGISFQKTKTSMSHCQNNLISFNFLTAIDNNPSNMILSIYHKICHF